MSEVLSYKLRINVLETGLEKELRSSTIVKETLKLVASPLINFGKKYVLVNFRKKLSETMDVHL